MYVINHAHKKSDVSNPKRQVILLTKKAILLPNAN